MAMKKIRNISLVVVIKQYKKMCWVQKISRLSLYCDGYLQRCKIRFRVNILKQKRNNSKCTVYNVTMNSINTFITLITLKTADVFLLYSSICCVLSIILCT
jgi:hypothetical protein